ncbi:MULTISPECIES: hypothetical protein [unclassified Microcoleus]|uniref:hypothetical protein n=1 Tax=unclassified Microcoleus TaxID=2642155 RepID=UPI002FD6C43F
MDDIYASETKEAVGFGFVARFSQNNTFRPQLAVTREQLVSLVLESWKGIQDAISHFLAMFISVPIAMLILSAGVPEKFYLRGKTR